MAVVQRAPRDTMLRIGVAFLLAVAAWWFATRLLGDVLAPVLPDRGSHAVRAIVLAAQVVPPTLWAWRRLDARPLRERGLGRPGCSVVVGAVGWLVPAAIGLAVAVSVGWLELAPTAPTLGMLGVLVARLLLVACYEALPEELLFRGYLHALLADRVPRWAAVALQAALFTLFGVVVAGAAESIDRLILFVTFGLVLGTYRAVTGSVWSCVGFHLAFQTVAQAHRDGELPFLAVREIATGTVDVVVLWFFPIVLGGLALAAGAAVARRRQLT